MKNVTVTIGEDGNWYVDGKDTGVKVKEEPSLLKKTFRSLPNTQIMTGMSLLFTAVVGVVAYLLGRLRREK